MNDMNESTSRSHIKTCYVLDDQTQMITSFPTNDGIAIHIFASIFMIVLALTTVSLNGVTVFAIWRSRTLKEKPANFTIMLQSIVDLGNGTLVMPLLIVQWATEVAGKPNCATMYVLKKSAMLFFFYTLITLSVMNFDRYMGVLHPFVRHRLVTNERILKCVVTACLVQTIIYAFTLTHNEVAHPIVSTIVLSFILVTVFVYLKIFLKVRGRGRVGAELVEVDSEKKTARNSSESNVSKKHVKSRDEKAKFLKELKCAKFSFLVVICCLICYLPGALSFGPLNLKSSYKAIAIKIIFVLLSMLNSSLNNVIYFWLNSMLRKQGKDVVKNMFKGLCHDTA